MITGKEVSAEERAILNGEVLEVIRKGDHTPADLVSEVRDAIGLAGNNPIPENKTPNEDADNPFGGRQ
ncbi:MAG: hypothetical protein R3F31_05240 [Verrucomicrobiales bacterium]